MAKTGRWMLGETNPAGSKPVTIHGDSCIQVGRNIIHCSDSVKSAEGEISLWFKPKELVTTRPVHLAGSMNKRWTKHQFPFALQSMDLGAIGSILLF